MPVVGSGVDMFISRFKGVFNIGVRTSVTGITAAKIVAVCCVAYGCLMALGGAADTARGQILPSGTLPMQLMIGFTRAQRNEPGPSRQLSSSNFGKPVIREVSGRCATVEFAYSGASVIREKVGLGDVYVFARRQSEPDFLQWGGALQARRVGHSDVFAVLMRGLPLGEQFSVQVAADSMLGGPRSEASDVASTHTATSVPAAPQSLIAHRTDPRNNHNVHDGSVCVDLHWSHPHPRAAAKPGDVHFRIVYSYEGEDEIVYCEDEVGNLDRACGLPIQTVREGLPSLYMTLCDLRPNRRVRFRVSALTCDEEAVDEEFHVTTPPSAPSVVARLIISPESQEAIAGFQPRAVFDWIPQHDELILGHAIYLGLKHVSAMKLLCWVPHTDASATSRKKNSDGLETGHLSLPVVHRNHTYAEHWSLLGAYLAHKSVHQEQEVLITTRVVGSLESPAFRHHLGEWLVLDATLKCLTSFDAERPTYVASKIPLSWTQEQALSEFSAVR
eukprot:TRINITY_DN43798_c0_g1_i1.p1 TRINITY_DN43798_c0_g1~~TRINITY_DN43798_c0_g1_i1.p1  ORF type:complete len:537 (-),score=62.35 TRINITY_DN43798_c0_g1_i1:254-1759(-)